jgi:CheY-like chemotaxis protein
MVTQTRSILLVDDDPEVVWALGRYFTRAGFPVATCGDGDEAISLLATRGFDTVITDIRMPRLNGFALIDWLRNNRPGTRIIVMTGFGGPSIRQLSIRKGAILYLEKPVDPTFLLEVLSSEDDGTHFSGNVDRIDILDYLQLMMLSGKQVVLEILSRDLHRGVLFIDKGEIRHAACDGLEGEEAVYRCLSFDGGSFVNHPWTEPEKTTIRRPGEFLLMEAARHRDESRAGSESRCG